MTKLKFVFKPTFKKLHISTKKSVTSRTLGFYKSVFKGKGLEFEEYRKYAVGLDDASTIDWKASLRSNDLLVREYVEERNLNVHLLIDVSSSMLIGYSQAKLKYQYAGELAASLSFAILETGDKIGFTLFSDKIVKKSFPRKEKKQYTRLIYALINPKNYGGKYNLSFALDDCLKTLPSNTVLIIISSFIGLKNDWEKKLKMCSKKFDIFGIMIRDQLDKTLPVGAGYLLLENPFDSDQMLIRSSETRKKYEHEAKKQEEQIKKSFFRSGANITELLTTQKFVTPLQLFLGPSIK